MTAAYRGGRLARRAAALLLAALAAPAATAQAQEGAPIDPAAAPATPPPVTIPAPGPRPYVTLMTCQVGCTGLNRAAAGSTVRISGEALDGAATVSFLGGAGAKDDVVAPLANATPTSADVVVPRTARSGRIRVIAADGRRSLASRRTIQIHSARARAAARVEARVDRKTVLIDGPRKASVSFFVGGAGSAPAAVRVDLLRDGDPAPVASWPVEVPPGTVGNVAWDGTIAGAAPPEGRYVFQVTGPPAPSAGATAAQATEPAPAASSGFLLVGHAFPVQGAHQLATEPQQRFGAGRAGHVHQGVDVMAACGTPLVVARTGTVKMSTFQGAAGNYVVIAGDDGLDQVYMHLASPSPLQKGQAVTTGQALGVVGATGDAVGCHLHFELWSAPGWYTGGAPVDPYPALAGWGAAG